MFVFDFHTVQSAVVYDSSQVGESFSCIVPRYRYFHLAEGAHEHSFSGPTGAGLYGKEKDHDYLDACAQNNTVPAIVCVLWFGSPMSANRSRAFNTIKATLLSPTTTLHSSPNGMCIPECSICPAITKLTTFAYTSCITTAGVMRTLSAR